MIDPKKNHATVKLDSNGCSWNENLQRKQNWTAKSTNVKENSGKINSIFVIRVTLWARKAWMFPWIVLELKEYARKTCGCGQHWTPFDSSFEWKEGYRRWKCVSSVVSDSQISLTWYRRHLMAAIQLAASCGELYFSRYSALKRTGTFASESKVMCLFYKLTEFKKWWCFIRLTSIWRICVNNYFKIEKSWIF